MIRFSNQESWNLFWKGVVFKKWIWIFHWRGGDFRKNKIIPLLLWLIWNKFRWCILYDLIEICVYEVNIDPKYLGLDSKINLYFIYIREWSSVTKSFRDIRIIKSLKSNIICIYFLICTQIIFFIRFFQNNIFLYLFVLRHIMRWKIWILGIL